MCINRLKISLSADCVKCPFDSEISICFDVQSLQKNFEVIRIVEEIKERRRKEGRSTPDVLVTTPCHEVSAHVAQLHCKECRADLCRECSEKIHKIKLFHSHVPVPLSVMETRELNCPVHRTSEANLICTVSGKSFFSICCILFFSNTPALLHIRSDAALVFSSENIVATSRRSVFHRFDCTFQ